MVLNDLDRAQQLVREMAADEAGIDPQFRITAPEGDYRLTMPLSEDPCECGRQFELIKKFMALNTAPAFTMAGGTTEPEGVFCVGVSHREALCALAPLERDPLRFSFIEWPEPKALGGEVLGLLPRGELSLSPADIEEIDAYFGPVGKFPAMRLC
jgi:hypothetical protein